MQRIEISNFGPIKNVAFDIRDYTVFIGPQATGKSTIAKAVYFFKSLADELKSCFSKSSQTDFLSFGPDLFKIALAEKCNAYWDRIYWNPDAIIKFTFDGEKNEFITIQNNNSHNRSLKICLSDSVHEQFRPLQESIIKKNDSSNNKTKEKDGILVDAFFAFLFQSKLNSFFSGNDIYSYIPAGRTIFSSIRNELNPRSDMFINDYLVGEFISAINQIRKFFSNNTITERIDETINEHVLTVKGLTHKHVDASRWKKTIHSIHAIMQKILTGDYRNIDDDDLIFMAQDKKIPVINSSSGQQESLWIFLYLISTLLGNSRFFTIIEEPEAHLFPDAQKNMMHALTLYANGHRRNQLMLTTHSPYILTPLNNLLYAHTLGQDELKREQVAKIIDPDLWLDPSRFECYYVDGGEVTSVVDREVNMINLERLDSASTIGNEEYDKLSELEG